MIRRGTKRFLRVNFIRHLISGMANLKAFWILSIFLTIGLIGVIILQTQSLAQGYELVFHAQGEIAELSVSNNQDELSFSSQEISDFNELAQNLNFERIDKVHYIRAIESTVLAR